VAADVVRLRLHPAWLEHVTTNIPLTTDQLHQQYEAVFPGVEFAALHKEVTAAHWRAPS